MHCNLKTIEMSSNAVDITVEFALEATFTARGMPYYGGN